MNSRSPVTTLDSSNRYSEEIQDLHGRKTVVERLIACLEEYARLKPLAEKPRRGRKPRVQPIRKPAAVQQWSYRPDLKKIAS